MITVTQTELDRARLKAMNIKPEDLADDKTDYAGKKVVKPWGSEFEVYNNGEISIWRLELLPDSETSMHAHPGKLTMLIVSEGSVVFSTLEKCFTLNSGAVLVIEPGVFHKSATRNGAILLEMETPPNKRDLVRIYDRYGREGQGYEQQPR